MTHKTIISVLSLSLIAGVCALLIGTIKWLTDAPIKANKRHHAQALIREMSGGMRFQRYALPQREGDAAYLGKQTYYYLSENKRMLILPWTALNAYHGSIRFLLALHADGSIKNVRVTEHRETPALGDKIELAKSTWILSFNGKHKTTQQDFQVKKYGGQFDQFSGATITPQALTLGIYQALSYVERYNSLLFNKDNKIIDNVE